MGYAVMGLSVFAERFDVCLVQGCSCWLQNFRTRHLVLRVDLLLDGCLLAGWSGGTGLTTVGLTVAESLLAYRAVMLLQVPSNRVEACLNMMAHAQKPDFVFLRNLF